MWLPGISISESLEKGEGHIFRTTRSKRDRTPVTDVGDFPEGVTHHSPLPDRRSAPAGVPPPPFFRDILPRKTGIPFPGARLPVGQPVGIGYPRRHGQAEVPGKRIDIGLVGLPDVPKLRLRRVPLHEPVAGSGEHRAQSLDILSSGSLSVDGLSGGRLNTAAISITAWRAMAKVSSAWRLHVLSSPARTRALVSRTAVSAASHDWLSCCER